MRIFSRKLASSVRPVLGLALVVWTLGGVVRPAEGRPPWVFKDAEPSLRTQVAQLDVDLERWAAFGFSGAVLVAQGDRVLMSRGYGLSNRARRSAVTSGTLFDIGSLSKQFTAAAVLKLAESGRVRVHGSIGAILPDVPSDKQSLTIHQLLTHTSGISDFGSETESLSRTELVRRILAAPLARAPGTGYEYSNLGYTLLAAIVEMASGVPFESYLNRALFRPAGMRRTTFTWMLRSRGTDGLAMGYGGFRRPADGEDPYDRVRSWRLRGSGSVLSCVEDLFLWHRALTGGLVLNAASRDAMFTGHCTAEAEFLSYGYGWRIQTTSDGKRLVWHSGLDESYSSMFRFYADEGIVMIFLSNTSIGGVPLREIMVPPSRSGPPSSRLFAEAILSVPDFQSRRSDLRGYAGTYRVGASGRWTVKVANPEVLLYAEGQEALDALFPPKDASIEAAYAAATRRAAALASCLADPSCAGDPRLAAIDALGYSQRGARQVSRDWERAGRRLGRLQRIDTLGTTSLRGRPSTRLVTLLRLVFSRGTVDEHVIWFADDEVYFVPGRSEAAAIRFRPAHGGNGLVGFELTSQRRYSAKTSTGHSSLTISVEGREVRGLHETRANSRSVRKR